MSAIGLGLALLSALIAAFGVPLWLGKVSPNRFYGFRTPLTVNQPEMWYPINAIAGRDLVISGLLSSLLVLAGDFWTLGPDEPLFLALWLTPILVGVVHSFWAASAYVGEQIAPPQEAPEVEAQSAERARRAQRRSESEP